MSDSHSRVREISYDLLSRCVAGRTHKLGRAIDTIFNEELAEFGLRNTQLTLLAVIAYMGETTAVELGPVLLMEKSTISRNLAVMRKNGWVAVARAGRPQAMRLTSIGKRRLEGALPAWERAQERARALLSEEGFSMLHELGDRVGAVPEPDVTV